MMRSLAVLVLVLLAGCSASRNGDPAGSTPSQAVVSAGTRGSVVITRDRGMVASDVGASPADVWPLVVQAYADIGFPMDHVDHSARVATATNQRVRRLAGKGMSDYFNCAGPFGNTANRDDVFVTVRTQVEPGQENGSIVRIGVSALSRSTTAANTVTDCGSTGALERLVIDTIVQRAARR